MQHEPLVHVIFWGSNWSQAPNSEARASILKMFEGLSGSAYQEVLTQYFDPTGRISATVGVNSYTDTQVSAPANVTFSDFEPEINHALEKNPTWKREPNAQFAVLPAPGTTYAQGFNGFCAYHDIDGQGGVFLVLPYAGDPPFSTEDACQAYYGGGDATKATSLMASHEYTEAATDPYWNTKPAWLDSEGYENGDICSTPYDELPNGTFVQGTYDDHQNACSISDKNPPHVLGITDTATQVTLHSATLNATINPESLETSYQFEYGTTTAYGTVVPSKAVSVGSGRSNIEVKEALAGLSLGQKYHYRVVASNSNGTTYGEDRTFIPSRWTIQPQSEPERNSYSWLNEVSCVSHDACMAVGKYYENGTFGLSYQGPGNSWQFHAVPASPQSNGSELTGVSCSSANACTAVGVDYVPNGTPQADRWNGSSWTEQSVPVPTGSAYAEFSSVSCASSSECIAVGINQNSSGGSFGYSARWKSGTWTNLETPNPKGTGQSQINDISCVNSTMCVAVGWWWAETGGARRLIMNWNGSSWSIQTAAVELGALNGVVCLSTNFCMADGLPADSNGFLVQGTVAERWDGTKWTSETLPSEIPDATSGWLADISCSSASTCMASGGAYSSKNGAAFPLVEKWNGSTWSVELSARESETARNEIWGISCVVRFDCVGVGPSIATGTWEPFVETRPSFQPTVTNEAVSKVATSSATLNGTVNPEGFDTTYQFEYGTTTGYGSRAPTTPKSIGSGESAVAVSEAISGLKSHTTYHYRVVAVNEEGTTYSKDETFTTGPTYLSSFGSKGSGSGQFNSPFGIAADSAGNVWVVDYSNNRVQKFNSSGTFLAAWGWGVADGQAKSEVCTSNCQAGIAGSGNGQFNGPDDIAIDSSGNLWITDGGNARVQEFNSKGEYLSKFGSSGYGNGQFLSPSGVTVAPNGHVWVADWSYSRVQEFTASGEFVQSVNGGWPGHIAADAEGNIWVANFGNENKVGKIDPKKGAYVSEFGSWGPGNGQFEGLQTIDVMPSGNILVADRYSGRVQELTPSGQYVTKFQSGGVGDIEEPNGIGVGPGGAIYVADTRNNRVQKWCIPAAPEGSTQAASSVTTTEATLNGTVNPHCAATTYQFEYGKTTSYGSKAPANPQSVGSGTDPVAVSQVLSGLGANTTYHYRLVAENSEGVTYGKDETFTTPATTAAQLSALAVTEPFNGTTSSVTNFNTNWTALGWAGGSPAKGADTTSGWGPVPAYPTINGAFYSATVTDSGSGGAAVATMAVSPGNTSRYFSLWLDMPTPSGTKAGYELRFTCVSSGTYNVSLSKWQGGSQTVLASQSSYSFAVGNSLAIVDQGGTVSAWTNKGSGFGQILSANDSAFSSGKTGVEGSGYITRLTNFKAGSL